MHSKINLLIKKYKTSNPLEAIIKAINDKKIIKYLDNFK